MTRPTIDNVWASGGTSVDPGASKINTGWLAEIPPFETQNFWQNRVDQLLQNIEQNGIMEWDAATTYSIGSWVLGSDKEIYKSITNSNTGNDPIGSPLNWTAFTDLVSVSDATETVKGIAEIATLTEAQAGTDDTRIMTPKKVKDAIQQIVPDASTAVKGKVELASNSETQAGTDTVRAVTPAGLASVTATETRAGLVERATDAEADAGLDTTRYLSPKQLADKISSEVPVASETAQGKIEIATQAETDAEVDDTRAVTPKKLLGKLTLGFSISLGTQGHIRLPNFMAGGFTLNWGRGTGGTNEVFSRPFTTVYGVVMSRYNSTADPEREAQPQNITTTGFLISTNGPAANNFWVAVGVS